MDVPFFGGCACGAVRYEVILNDAARYIRPDWSLDVIDDNKRNNEIGQLNARLPFTGSFDLTEVR
jgi:hypothetical protein